MPLLADDPSYVTLDVAIVGAQKAATSSLLSYFRAIGPPFCVQETDELGDLADPVRAQHPLKIADWFHPDNDEHVYVGKLAGLMYRPDAIENLSYTHPGVRVLAVLRHPVDRAYSGYWQQLREGQEWIATFEDALHADPIRFGDDHERRLRCDYLRLSRYDEPIRQLQLAFGGRLSVCIFEDLVASPANTVEQLMNGFDSDLSELPPALPRENGAGGVRSQLVARATRTHGAIHRSARRVLPRKMGRMLRRRIRQENDMSFVPSPLDPEVQRTVYEALRPSIERTSELLDRDLAAIWAPPR